MDQCETDRLRHGAAIFRADDNKRAVSIRDVKKYLRETAKARYDKKPIVGMSIHLEKPVQKQLRNLVHANGVCGQV